MKKILVLLLGSLLAALGSFAQEASRWSEAQAAEWSGRQPWFVGSNYIPATAINQLEMWQAETFDPQRIDLELGWAESMGLNSLRVFLDDLVWQQDAAGFEERIERFLQIAERHHLKTLFVLFDSCWDPNPSLGKQRAPRPGVHNSGWVQSPGAAALSDRKQWPRLEAYVKGVVGGFARDRRVLGWDVWNEPSNTNEGSYSKREPLHKKELVKELLPQVFAWVRQAGATQPLTSGLWEGHWSSPAKLDPIAQIQLRESDVLSFHSYEKPSEFRKRVVWLQKYRRPILCTEYMARPRGSTFYGILPIAKQYHVGAMNWGLVAGKTQTWLPWDSWKKPYTRRPPKEWFHDIFRFDGQPYRKGEVEFIRAMTVTTDPLPSSPEQGRSFPSPHLWR